MQIIYLGHSCFKIRSKNIVLLTDPFDKYVGFSMPKTKTDIVTISHAHKDHSSLEKVEGEPFIIKAPGEYEVSGISIFALPSFHDEQQGAERGKNLIFVIAMDDMRLCHLGDLGAALKEKQLEEINGVDVLFIPVGGFYTIGPSKAKELITKVAPKIAIPMHFRTSESSQGLSKIATLDEFLKEMGIEEPRREEKLVVNKTSLPEETEVIVLERK